MSQNRIAFPPTCLAEKLGAVLEVLGVDAVYSTDYERTRDTAKPTAKKLAKKIQPYGRLTPEWFKKMKSAHAGQSVLIVGHSNTVVDIVNGLGGSSNHKIEEMEFDNLFILTAEDDKTKMVRIKFWKKN